MKLILNIGLDVKATSTLAASTALEIVKANGFLVHRSAVHQSDTEATLVTEVSLNPLGQAQGAPGLNASLFWTAVDLQQDCIAAYCEPIKKGALVGPESRKWGAFNPALFLNLDGTRLSA